MKMHTDQVDIREVTAACLVREQFPHWAGWPIHAVASDGTDNALFRLGDDVVLRFPLRCSADEERRTSLLREQDVARRVKSHVSVAVPEPLALGAPGPGYGGWWTAYRWIPGATVADLDWRTHPEFADDLADFVSALQGIETGGGAWDGRSRGGPLTLKDSEVRTALRLSAGLIDVAAVADAWEKAVAVPRGDGPDVWLHADLMPGNLLVADGRLVGVIDLGSACIGDPAVDLMPAWNTLDVHARSRFRAGLSTDEATWERGRGWAIAQALVALPYYVATNPVMADTARRTLAASLE